MATREWWLYCSAGHPPPPRPEEAPAPLLLSKTVLMTMCHFRRDRDSANVFVTATASLLSLPIFS